jgi:hypothetical protein
MYYFSFSHINALVPERHEVSQSMNLIYRKPVNLPLTLPNDGPSLESVFSLSSLGVLQSIMQEDGEILVGMTSVV